MKKVACAIIGTGNIGTDLLIKILRGSSVLEVAAFVGVDPESRGIRLAGRLGVSTSAAGIDGLLRMSKFDEFALVFDATSAAAHARHDVLLRERGKRIIDLTPAALGPYVVPAVNLVANIAEPNINMVTCGGQATIPIVAAVNAVSPVRYAEIVASIASRSAGPGTRANIDEFTHTTARAIETVGGAKDGKAIIILNPAEPPMIMRDTVYCLCEAGDEDGIEASVSAMLRNVQAYVPGYRLKQRVQFERYGDANPLFIPELNLAFKGLRVTVLLEVEGAGHYLPSYAGNLDIMTSSALMTAERIVLQSGAEGVSA